MVWEAMTPEPGKSTPTRQGVLYAELRGTLPGRYLRGGTFRGLKRLLLGRAASLAALDSARCSSSCTHVERHAELMQLKRSFSI
jgi:hypothetical protein